ncbi:MAG: sulfatase-like hydrolase/transferase, partial [Chitinophagaceae bacterium]
DLWTAKAKTLIIEKSRQKGKPFFLYLAYDVPHAVLELPTQAYPKGNGLKGGLQWLGKPGNMINTASGTPDSYVHPDYANATYDDDKNAVTPEVAWPDTYKRYATACRRIDDGIGDILQLLKDLEIDQNTLVVFTSDNGPSIESYLPDNVVPNHPTFFNSFGPFDGIKRDVWEGGVRMPTIVQWPGTVPANKVINQPSISYDWLPTFTDAANIAIPARIDGVSLIPELTGKGKQHESLVYIEYENNTKTPDFKEFAPNHRSRLRNQMQKIRLGDFVGVRYNIQSAADDFEIYNVVTDPQETRNLASSASFKTLQQQFKTKVLQVRRSDTSAIRPYDKAMVPGVSANKVSPGIKWMSFEGNFPWVARVSSLKPSGQGVLTKMDGINVQVKPGIFYLEGFIKIPSDGTYTFTMRGEGGFLLRIHDAMVIDGSYQYKNGEPISGSINLSEGYHPFRIYYHQKNLANPLVSIHWQANGGPFQPIPSKNLFH